MTTSASITGRSTSGSDLRKTIIKPNPEAGSASINSVRSGSMPQCQSQPVGKYKIRRQKDTCSLRYAKRTLRNIETPGARAVTAAQESNPDGQNTAGTANFRARQPFK